MRKIIFQLFIIFSLCVPAGYSQEQQPDSAQNILNATLMKAQSSKSNVLVVFQASWCIWCKWLDSAFESIELKPIMEKHYVIVRLDVKEFGKKIQTIENPGGQKLLEELGGIKSGLPFLAVLNKKGTMIANSNVMPKNQNIGYPGSKKEIDAFIKFLKQTAPRITDKECTSIAKYLEKNAPQ
jgi:thioredoxin-related protein